MRRSSGAAPYQLSITSVVALHPCGVNPSGMKSGHCSRIPRSHLPISADVVGLSDQSPMTVGAGNSGLPGIHSLRFSPVILATSTKSRPQALSPNPLMGAICGKRAPSGLPVALILCESECSSRNPNDSSLFSSTLSTITFAMRLRSPKRALAYTANKKTPAANLSTSALLESYKKFSRNRMDLTFSVVDCLRNGRACCEARIMSRRLPYHSQVQPHAS